MVFKRCFYFDRNGNPLQQGCPRKASCHFIHPNDPEWDQAPDSYPPAHIRQRRSPPAETRKFEAPKSPRERNRSSSRHTSHQDPSPRRHISRDRSEGEVSRYDEPPERPHRQSSDHQRRSETSPRDSKTLHSTPQTDNIPHSNSNTGTLMAPPSIPPSMPPTLLQPPSPVELHPSSLLPPASSVPIFPPPPPIPTASLWQKKPPPTRPDPTPEEARIIWLERIKVMTECLRNEKQLKKLRKDIAEAKHNLARQRAITLPEETEREMKSHLDILESQRDELEKAFENNMLQLVKSKSWPMAPEPADEGQEEKSQEGYLRDLIGKATEMYKVLVDIRERNTQTAGPTMDIDIDSEGNSSRPLKRRRLSESESSVNAQSQPSAQDIEALRDRVVNVEGRLSAFKNDLDAHDAELAADIEERLVAKLESHHLGRTATVTVSPDDHREMQENIKKTGLDMDEIAIEITDLIKQATAQQADRVAIQREIETLNSGFKGFQERLQQFEINRKQHQTTIEALEAAVAAHSAKPPSPPNSPQMPTQEYILEELEDPLVDMVRKHTKPLIETMRSQVEELLRIQNKEMYDIFSSKLTLTLRTMEAISGRIGTPDMSAIVPEP